MAYQLFIKTKNIILATSFVLIFGCQNNSNTEPKINYSGYYIPVEGGRIDMKLDSITPLNDLILRLRETNELYDTHKGYLIGYNDLMFSIAVHSNKAIQPLLDFIDTTNSYEAKLAAVYTLYLIGINCKVDWGPYDEFTNITAREGLFKLLANNESLQMDIAMLLIRDPRESDVPKLFRLLDSLRSDCWPITSALLRYDLKNIPVKHDIPEDLLSMKIWFTKQMNYPDSAIFSEIFLEFSKKYAEFIQVEDTLYHYNFQMPIRWSYENTEIYISYLTNTCLRVGNGMIGANYQYFYKDGKINFCSALTSKRLWLEWWNTQRPSYKDSLNNGYKKIGINRI